MEYEGGGANISATGFGPEDANIVEAHAKIVSQHIRSQTQMRLGLYALAAFFMLAAATLVVFAPDGRQTSTIVIAAALVIVAAGIAGFASLRLSAPGVEIGAGSGNGEIANRPARKSAGRKRK